MSDDFRFAVDVRVRLPETDAFGVCYHGSFFTYFDVARMDYLRAAGLMDVVKAGRASNLIVHSSADFKSPAGFDDLLTVRARVAELGSTSFTFEFRVERKDDGTLVAVGRSVHVTIDATTRRPVPLPGELREAVRRVEGPALRER
ncbi:MAG TPA: thioesterase family protein [Planctomycetota bacterium]|nr:thioesterase family protein [Planctomycetota bacterium]